MQLQPINAIEIELARVRERITQLQADEAALRRVRVILAKSDAAGPRSMYPDDGGLKEQVREIDDCQSGFDDVRDHFTNTEGASGVEGGGRERAPDDGLPMAPPKGEERTPDTALPTIDESEVAEAHQPDEVEETLGEQLLRQVRDAATRRGLAMARVSREIFGNAAQVYALKNKCSDWDETRVRAWLDGKPQPRRDVDDSRKEAPLPSKAWPEEFQAQIERVARGEAKIAPVIPIRKPDPDGTLGGVATSQL